MGKLTEYIDLTRGITTVIGSGGKTSLMRSLAVELDGSVILTTSTKIFAYDDLPLYTGSSAGGLKDMLRTERVVCVGSPCGIKLSESPVPIEEMAEASDYVLVEGDGANRKPLKAHDTFEPVIPAGTGNVILVIGASGFGMKTDEAVHRSGIYREKLRNFPGIRPDNVSPELYAAHAARELETGVLHLPSGCRLSIFINQTDTAEDLDKARSFADAFRRLCGGSEIPITAGSLNREVYYII